MCARATAGLPRLTGPTATVEIVWKYDVRDWHESTGLSHEEWLLQLRAEGWELELPDYPEGSRIELDGRMVTRHAVKRWVPDRSTSR